MRRVRVAQFQRRQIVRRVNLDDRHVSLCIKADHLTAKLFTRQQPDGNSRCVLNDVIVGENVALRIDNEAAADAALGTTLLATKHVEQRIGRRDRVLVALVRDLGRGLCRLDVDDRRFDAFGDLGKRSRQGLRRARNLRLVLRHRRPAGKHRAYPGARHQARDRQRHNPDAQLSQNRPLVNRCLTFGKLEHNSPPSIKLNSLWLLALRSLPLGSLRFALSPVIRKRGFRV